MSYKLAWLDIRAVYRAAQAKAEESQGNPASFSNGLEWANYEEALCTAMEELMEDQITPSWKPISTAPKDGTVILSCVANNNLYSPRATVWATYHPNAKGAATWRTAQICGQKLNPTHWMRLPWSPLT